MNRMRFMTAAAVLAFAPAVHAATAPEATATFDRIRTTPAELKLHCEQLKLQGDVVRVRSRAEQGADPAKMNARIAEIQRQLKGYKEAVDVVADKAVAGGTAYFKTPEGQALDGAQKQLTNACIPKAGTK